MVISGKVSVKKMHCLSLPVEFSSISCKSRQLFPPKGPLSPTQMVLFHWFYPNRLYKMWQLSTKIICLPPRISLNHGFFYGIHLD